MEEIRCPRFTSHNGMSPLSRAGFVLRMRIFAVSTMFVMFMGLAHADEGQGRMLPHSGDVGTIGLVDAVRLTLAKNPDIQLHEKQVEIGHGSLQQATGQFDSTVGLTVGGSVNNTPLSQVLRNTYASEGLPFTTLQTNTT